MKRGLPGVTGPAVVAARSARDGRGTSSAGLRSKKPTGLSMKPIVRHRHHRPVLRPHDVVGAERVPDHDVGVLERRVVLARSSGSPAPPGCWFG